MTLVIASYFTLQTLTSSIISKKAYPISVSAAMKAKLFVQQNEIRTSIYKKDWEMILPMPLPYSKPSFWVSEHVEWQFISSHTHLNKQDLHLRL